MKILKTVKKLINSLKNIEKYNIEIENIKFQNGSILYNLNLQKNSKNILDYEFKVFSQWGEDGIIAFLINNLNIENKFFVEFGVENYVESNTRFLLKKNNWSGLIIDSSIKNIDFIKKDQIYWRHDIKALCEYISKNQKQLIINKKKLVIFHKRYNKIYHYPLSKSFFTEILNKDAFEKIILNGKLKENDENYIVKCILKEKGDIDFYFDKKD